MAFLKELVHHLVSLNAGSAEASALHYFEQNPLHLILVSPQRNIRINSGQRSTLGWIDVNMVRHPHNRAVHTVHLCMLKTCHVFHLSDGYDESN